MIRPPAYELKLAGFRAHCSVRGRLFKRPGQLNLLTGLVETQTTDGFQFSTARSEAANAKLHFAREDIYKPEMIQVGDFWKNDQDECGTINYRITGIVNHPNSPVIVYDCEVHSE